LEIHISRVNYEETSSS